MDDDRKTWPVPNMMALYMVWHSWPHDFSLKGDGRGFGCFKALFIQPVFPCSTLTSFSQRKQFLRIHIKLDDCRDYCGFNLTSSKSLSPCLAVFDSSFKQTCLRIFADFAEELWEHSETKWKVIGKHGSMWICTIIPFAMRFFDPNWKKMNLKGGYGAKQKNCCFMFYPPPKT